MIIPIGYGAVSGWGPGFGLGRKKKDFWETYFQDQNSYIQIFRLITKKVDKYQMHFFFFLIFHYGT